MVRLLSRVVAAVLFLLQIAALWLINSCAHWLVERFHLPLPGNALAVLLVFVLLQTGLLPLAAVERSATLLLRHLGLFFLPIAVGLMSFAALWVSNGLAIALVLLASAAVGMGVTGRIFQSLSRIGAMLARRH